MFVDYMRASLFPLKIEVPFQRVCIYRTRVSPLLHVIDDEKMKQATKDKSILQQSSSLFVALSMDIIMHDGQQMEVL